MLLLRCLRELRGSHSNLSKLQLLQSLPFTSDTNSLHSQALVSSSPSPGLSLNGSQGNSRFYASSTSTSGRQGPFDVEVSVKAFEQRYVKRAATAIRDLMMINCAPKSKSAIMRSSLATGQSPPDPVNVVIPHDHKEVKVNFKRTRFTVLRGPHVDKKGMEQFERRQYKAILSVSTNSADEVRWILDHLKLYEFTGTQLKIIVGSSSYITPTMFDTSTGASDTPSTTSPNDASVLASHRSHISRYLTPVNASSVGVPEVEEEMSSALKTLREVMDMGLKKRRQDLTGDSAFQSWHHINKRKDVHTSSSTHSGDPLPSAAPTGTDPASSQLPPLEDKQRQQASAFLEAVDAALLDVKLGALQSSKNFPYHFATFVPGSGSVPAAQWMQAMVKMGQYEQMLAQSSKNFPFHFATFVPGSGSVPAAQWMQAMAPANQAKLLKLYCGQSLVAHVLQYELLKTWGQQVSSDMKSYLALPPANLNITGVKSKKS
eukprot:gene22868-30042_t